VSTAATVAGAPPTVMRTDNHGEGGILALLALISPSRARQNRRRAAMIIVGLIGATLLYGDGCITPAISVLSAIDGNRRRIRNMNGEVCDRRERKGIKPNRQPID
jgi:K+ transporter